MREKRVATDAANRQRASRGVETALRQGRVDLGGRLSAVDQKVRVDGDDRMRAKVESPGDAVDLKPPLPSLLGRLAEALLQAPGQRRAVGIKALDIAVALEKSQ